jgi:hypothetical protein
VAYFKALSQNLSRLNGKKGVSDSAVGGALQAIRSRVRFPMGSLGILIDLIHPAAL